jgi:hypothetical protein
MNHAARLLGLALSSAILVQIFRMPALAQSSRNIYQAEAPASPINQEIEAASRFTEADQLFQDGLKKLQEVEAIRQEIRHIRHQVFSEDQPPFDSDSERREYFRSQADPLRQQVTELQMEAMKDWLTSLDIYQDLTEQNEFISASRSREQEIVGNLIRLISENRIIESDNFLLQEKIRNLIDLFKNKKIGQVEASIVEN